MHNRAIMNRLSTEKRIQIVQAMIEGNSVRSITRMTGVCQEAILKLLHDLGTACADHHDRSVCNLRAKRIQCSPWFWATTRRPESLICFEAARFGPW